MRDVIAEAANATRDYISLIETWAATQTALFRNPPTAAMLKRARETAAEAGVPLPPEAAEHFGACREWLDRHAGSGPSAAQLQFAREVAARLGEEMPAAAAADRGELSRWLDGAKPRADALRREAMAGEPASDKQVALVKRAIGEGKLEAPEGWPKLSKLDASRLLDRLFKAGGKAAKGMGKPAGGTGKSRGSKAPAPARGGGASQTARTG